MKVFLSLKFKSWLTNNNQKSFLVKPEICISFSPTASYKSFLKTQPDKNKTAKEILAVCCIIIAVPRMSYTLFSHLYCWKDSGENKHTWKFSCETNIQNVNTENRHFQQIICEELKTFSFFACFLLSRASFSLHEQKVRGKNKSGRKKLSRFLNFSAASMKISSLETHNCFVWRSLMSIFLILHAWDGRAYRQRKKL